MEIHEYEVGLHKNELETPALLLDLAAVERNIQRMADFCKGAGIYARPHAKIYKATPVFAWMQLRAGAIGITVSKVSEAEVLANGGIRDILIANQVVGTRKIQRLVNLSAYTDLIVAVDSLENVRELSAAAHGRGVEVGILVEVNIGNNRCGVEPFEPTLELVRAIRSLPGLKFRGLMGYDGHLVFLKDFEERDRLSKAVYQTLIEVRDLIVQAGIPVEIVSGAGTCTYKAASSIPGITELQVGTYIFMDTTFRDNGISEYECTLSVLASVISRPKWPGAEDVAILDIGRKALDVFFGLPEVKNPPGVLYSMPQEHSRLRLDKSSPQLKIGDKVELWVKDANGTVNLYDKIYAMRNDIVEAVWDISGRGKAT